MTKISADEPKFPAHSLHLNERKSLNVQGVTEILSFDEEQIRLKTGYDLLIVSGKSLRIKSLLPEKNEAYIEGEIHTLAYSKGKATGMKRLSDLFR